MEIQQLREELEEKDRDLKEKEDSRRLLLHDFYEKGMVDAQGSLIGYSCYYILTLKSQHSSF